MEDERTIEEVIEEARLSITEEQLEANVTEQTAITNRLLAELILSIKNS